MEFTTLQSVASLRIIDQISDPVSLLSEAEIAVCKAAKGLQPASTLLAKVQSEKNKQ